MNPFNIRSVLTLFALIFLSAKLSAAAVANHRWLRSIQPSRKIALLHMYNDVSFFARLGKLTGQNKHRYAERHGYQFITSTPLGTSGVYKPVDCNADNSVIKSGPDVNGKCWGEDTGFSIDRSRAPTFGKIKLVLAACHGRSGHWFLWSDADAIVVNHSVALESIIDDAYDMMLSYDWLMLNAGVILFKCTAWTTEFLSKVYNAREFDKAIALDQSSIQSHMDNLQDFERKSHIKIIPKHAMNVYLEEYRPGDFLVHMAGKLYEATEAGLFALANQLDILSMIDDVEDINSFFRGRALLNYYSGTCPVKHGERQSSCKPNDPRRIFLNESLGSMSSPNRYRHVGLRYYWLGHWADKYDVPGWKKKKKALLIPNTYENRQLPSLLPSSHRAVSDGSVHRRDQSVNNADIKELVQDAPEWGGIDKVSQEEIRAEHFREREKKFPAEDISSIDDGDDDDSDVSQERRLSIYVWVIALWIGFITIVGVGITLKRRKLLSKVQ